MIGVEETLDGTEACLAISLATFAFTRVVNKTLSFFLFSKHFFMYVFVYLQESKNLSMVYLFAAYAMKFFDSLIRINDPHCIGSTRVYLPYSYRYYSYILKE